jgi:uncharacterized protein (TIRG00374 family)
MREKSKQKTWKTVFTVITLLALVGLIIGLHKQIISTVENLGKVNTWALLLVIPMEIFNYDAQARLYKATLSSLGQKVSYRFLYRFSLELNLVSTIFPSGGISGFSYTNIRFRTEGVSAAQATIVQLIKFFMIFFAFQILLIIGVLFLAIGGHANEVVILITGSLVTLLFLLTVGTIFIVGSRNRIDTVFTYITRAINRVIKVVRPKVKETINIERSRKVFNELHDHYLYFKKNQKELRAPLLFAVIANATEIGALYVFYLAFGHVVNPGAIILAYAVANFAGIISVLPAGIGVYETLMTLVLASAGISPSLSIPVTIMYRVVNTVIQVAPGYYFYQKSLQTKLVDNG